jgi:chromosome segregation ATPase
MESLTAESEKYLEEVTDRKNKLSQLREELAEANSDIKSTNQSFELVRRINELIRKPQPRKPQLSSQYTPSPKMEEYMALFGLLAGGAMGGAAYFLL